MRATYSWFSADLLTGQFRSTLPLKGTVSCQINGASTADLTLDLNDSSIQDRTRRTGEPWTTLLPDRRTLLVLTRQFDGDTTRGDPIWAGVMTGKTYGAGTTVSVKASTPEFLLSLRAITSTLTYLSSDPTATFSKVVHDVVAWCNSGGWGIQVDDGGSFTGGQNVTIAGPAHRLCSEVMDDLVAMNNGPEWYIEPRWDPAQTQAVDLWLVCRPRVGVAASSMPGGRPNAVFSYPGSVTDYSCTRSDGPGQGGNFVRATSSSGSAYQNAENTLYESYEGKWESPVQTQTPRFSTDLANDANRELTRVLGGTVTYTATLDIDNAPQFRRDWTLGDDTTLYVAPVDAEGRSAPSPGHPQGLNTTCRAIGWELADDFTTLTPTLWQPSETALGSVQ